MRRSMTVDPLAVGAVDQSNTLLASGCRDSTAPAWRVTPEQRGEVTAVPLSQDGEELHPAVKSTSLESLLSALERAHRLSDCSTLEAAYGPWSLSFAAERGLLTKVHPLHFTD